jgi:AraC-like DNA-binding protein
MFGAHYQVRRRDSGVTENVRAVALVGSRTSPSAELILSGNVDAFTIVFLPGAFSMLFGVPAIELTNGDFSGQEVLGPRIDELYARLGEVPAFQDRVHVANGFLTAMRPATESVSAIVKTARVMIRNNGSVCIGEMAHQTGLGLRQFERRFDREIGVTPKLYARIIRFEAALQRRAVLPTMPWTDIAHDLGYHDQMHMVHDFSRLAGDSPGAISRHLDMFVLPEVLSMKRGPLDSQSADHQ